MLPPFAEMSALTGFFIDSFPKAFRNKQKNPPFLFRRNVILYFILKQEYRQFLYCTKDPDN